MLWHVVPCRTRRDRGDAERRRHARDQCAITRLFAKAKLAAADIASDGAPSGTAAAR
jgi:hypothetical protein